MTIITMSTVGFGETRPLDPTGRIFTILIIVSTIFVGGYAVTNLSAFFIGGEIGVILRGRSMERSIKKMKNHCILIGFGMVGYEAAHAISDKNLIIIEKDEQRYNDALESGFHVIQGDATHYEVLRSTGIERASGMMIAIGMVADTILIALTAKELNPEINISARIDDSTAVSKLRRVGVNNIVTPSQIGGRRLAAFLRQPAIVDFLDLAMKRDDLSLKLEEIKVKSASTVTGKTLKESDIRKTSGGALVMSVLQPNGKHIVAPPADYVLQEGDTLIALGTDETLQNLSEILDVKKEKSKSRADTGEK